MVVGCLLVCRSDLYDLYVGRLACLVVGLVYLAGLVGWSGQAVNRLVYCSLSVGMLVSLRLSWLIGDLAAGSSIRAFAGC